MKAVVDVRKRNRQNQIRACQRTTLKPSEFCAKYLALDPKERGYRSACIRLIGEVTGLEFQTINKYGSNLDERCPENVQRMLAQEDFNRRIVDAIADNPQTYKYFLEKIEKDESLE